MSKAEPTTSGYVVSGIVLAIALGTIATYVYDRLPAVDEQAARATMARNADRAALTDCLIRTREQATYRTPRERCGDLAAILEREEEQGRR